MTKNKLKDILREQNMTLLELSEKTGISIHTLYSVNSGRSRPRKKTIEKISEVLHCPPEMLIPANTQFRPLSGDAIEQLDTMVSLYKNALELIENTAASLGRQMDEKMKSAFAKEVVKMSVERAQQKGTAPEIDLHFVEFLVAI